VVLFTFNGKAQDSLGDLSEFLGKVKEMLDGGQVTVYSLKKGEMVGMFKVPAAAIPDALNTYRYFHIDGNIGKVVRESNIGSLLQQILDAGFKPITKSEQAELRQRRGDADGLDIYPAFNADNTVDPGHVMVTTLRIKADGSIKNFAYRIKVSPDLNLGDIKYEDVFRNFMRDLINDGLKEAQNQDGGTYGGVDFRSLPAVMQPTVKPAAMSGVAPRVVSLKELNSEWQEIRKKMKAGPMPYNEIKLFVAACCVNNDAGAQRREAAACIAGILALEEDAAVATSPEMKEILAII
jgi:hypothetical protein